MKETLRTIRRSTAITTDELAQQARLSRSDVVAVEVGGYTSRAKAQRVVGAFNQLSGKNIRVEDIRIHCEEQML